MFFTLSLNACIKQEMISECTKTALNRKRAEGKILGRLKVVPALITPSYIISDRNGKTISKTRVKSLPG